MAQLWSYCEGDERVRKKGTATTKYRTSERTSESEQGSPGKGESEQGSPGKCEGEQGSRGKGESEQGSPGKAESLGAWA